MEVITAVISGENKLLVIINQLMCHFQIFSTTALPIRVYLDDVWTNWTRTNASATLATSEFSATRVSAK